MAVDFFTKMLPFFLKCNSVSIVQNIQNKASLEGSVFDS